ncbi:D-glycero-beta-D-manno-heptose 1,7-bisphosphate 7-phosphatase [uncultured Psychrosphaera sp.]|uniref:D-glycero-beta-D-manno-heptose 1,7-bisphosphate 7-phosphatase n=1 Tax=uncultured Psychrosphaera sp. TaxID=1403522 RepID=UPI0030F99A96
MAQSLNINTEYKKALFLDRDGVVNVDHGYVSEPKDFEFIQGVFEACKQFQEAGYQIVIITNQSGIGRGYYTEQEFEELSAWMTEQFKFNGVDILAVYHCPHHPTKANPPYLLQCDCRKPNPGMLFQAMQEHRLDPEISIMIGDKKSDIEAAKNAGIKQRFLVNSGQSLTSDGMSLADGTYADLLSAANDLLD